MRTSSRTAAVGLAVVVLVTGCGNWIVTNIGGLSDWEQRDDAIRNIANGQPADRLVPGPGSAIVAQFAPVASNINQFYEQLHGQDRRTTYPTAAVETAWQLLDTTGRHPTR